MKENKNTFQFFLEYLYNNKKIKKYSSISILSCSDYNNVKKLSGWEDIVFCIKDEHIWNISTVDANFTAFIITSIQKKENESLENLINFYTEVEHDLKIKKINKKYKIYCSDYEEFLNGEFIYISPHKPDNWYFNQ